MLVKYTGLVLFDDSVSGFNIDKIYNLFNDFGDGSEEKPKIYYGDEDLDDEEFNDDDEE